VKSRSTTAYRFRSIGIATLESIVCSILNDYYNHKLDSIKIRYLNRFHAHGNGGASITASHPSPSLFRFSADFH
jgi:hypothetical protein